MFVVIPVFSRDAEVNVGVRSPSNEPHELRISRLAIWHELVSRRNVIFDKLRIIQRKFVTLNILCIPIYLVIFGVPSGSKIDPSVSREILYAMLWSAHVVFIFPVIFLS